ncbi:hypothetical protein [Saccharicrinis fermentans]|uniref:Uncharacterized protein n=1 Tax=Saccharicrinis fermentans DSM 9555 = JCM 21142 TaxID=869213 RepID=W7YA76_9BACT|nr:hypothetical protein [Saccharicrinis fermentans]GAF04463.1 hypothetical protein JCM21142_83170 [Saccharicrinis fermentans DSM 9555 = JCM 21142]
MGILRTIKSDYEIYENHKKECLVAIEREDAKKIKIYYKKHKGKQNMPDDIIPGFKFVKDEEFDSLKIDFAHPLTFKIRDLSKVK